MFSTFLLAPSDFQTFLCHIQQHQHQLQLARPALFIFSFRPKNLAEVIVRHCQSTVSVTSKARVLGFEQRHISYSQRPEQNSGHIASKKQMTAEIRKEREQKSDLKKQKTSSIKFSIFHLISYVKNLASSLFLVVTNVFETYFGKSIQNEKGVFSKTSGDYIVVPNFCFLSQRLQILAPAMFFQAR